MRDHDLAADLLERDAAAGRKRMFRGRQQDDLVAPERNRLDAAIRGLEREHAEIERPVQDRAGYLPRRDPADVDEDVRMQDGKTLDVREQAVDGRFVRADDDPAPAHLLKLLDRGLRFARETEQPLRVVLQQASCFRQRAVARRPIEQALAELVLDPADRLADRRLRAVHPPRGSGKTTFGRDRQERRQVRQLHNSL